MSLTQAEPWPWSRRRWWAALFLIFLLQVVLIFWLSDKSVAVPRRLPSAPTLHLAPLESTELLALTDPTLFAKPHLESFSGSAWMIAQPQKFPTFQWTEPPKWLAFPTQQLGSVLTEFIHSNDFAKTERLPEASPFTDIPEPAQPPEAPRKSQLELLEGWANRPLLEAPSLPSWPATEGLTNTVLQLVVDASGKPVSTSLLSKSGLPEADQLALDVARKLRFAPAPSSGASLTWGKLMIDWATTTPATNPPAQK